jgi:hypothetical protein
MPVEPPVPALPPERIGTVSGAGVASFGADEQPMKSSEKVRVAIFEIELMMNISPVTMNLLAILS